MLGYKIDLSHRPLKERMKLSAKIQQHLFDLGFRWKDMSQTVQLTSKKYVTFSVHGMGYVLSRWWFDLYELKRITPSKFLKLSQEDLGKVAL